MRNDRFFKDFYIGQTPVFGLDPDFGKFGKSYYGGAFGAERLPELGKATEPRAPTPPAGSSGTTPPVGGAAPAAGTPPAAPAPAAAPAGGAGGSRAGRRWEGYIGGALPNPVDYGYEAFGRMAEGFGTPIPRGDYDNRHIEHSPILHNALQRWSNYSYKAPKRIGDKAVFDQHAARDFAMRKRLHDEVSDAYKKTISHTGSAASYFEKVANDRTKSDDERAAARDAMQRHLEYMRGVQSEFAHHILNKPKKATFIPYGQQVPEGAVGIGGEPLAPKGQGWERGRFGIPKPKQLTREKGVLGAGGALGVAGKIASGIFQAAPGVALASLGQNARVSSQPNTVLRRR